MFQRFGASAISVIQASRAECKRLNTTLVGTEHLLLGLILDQQSLAAHALLSMGINLENAKTELDRMAVASASTGAAYLGRQSICGDEDEPGFTGSAVKAIQLAHDYSRYFGQDEVRPEHLLLGLVDVKEASAIQMLEELGANLGFLRRQIMYLMAREFCLVKQAPTLRSALVQGMTGLIERNFEATESLSKLSNCSGTGLQRLPDRTEIVHMVFLGYLPDFLSTQVAFQRYLLQETLKLLEQRTGPLDQELTATIVSNSAQHLRSEVRATIEYLWSNEYRLFDQMLDEAEHDVIGTVIEDLWWAQSEEIALHELFDQAMDDHRRKHILSLQKRRIELSHRISKLRTRLSETIRQCFVKRSISA